MKLSTKSRYGLKAIERLVNAEQNETVAISALAAATGVSEAYLEQIMPLLKKADIVVSVRGAQGGYCLARAPQDITLGEVVRALDEDNLEIIGCISTPCGEDCKSRNVWTKIYQGINDTLDSMTLLELKA